MAPAKFVWAAYASTNLVLRLTQVMCARRVILVSQVRVFPGLAPQKLQPDLVRAVLPGAFV